MATGGRDPSPWGHVSILTEFSLRACFTAETPPGGVSAFCSRQPRAPHDFCPSIPYRSSVWDEFQHVAVYAITLVAWRRSIIENVPEMDAGTRTAHRYPLHSVCIVWVQGHSSFQRTEKAGPSRST